MAWVSESALGRLNRTALDLERLREERGDLLKEHELLRLRIRELERDYQEYVLDVELGLAKVGIGLTRQPSQRARTTVNRKRQPK